MKHDWMVTTSFQTGELDPTFEMRVDTNAYNAGMKLARNVQLLNGGGFQRRGGTYLLNSLASASRVEPFIFDQDEIYIVAFYNTAVRIYSINGTLLQTLTSAPWATADLFEIDVAQRGNVMVVTHQSFISQVIERTGASTFTLSDIVFETDISGFSKYQPYYKYQDAAVSVALGSTASETAVITGITQANPAVVTTSSSHGYSNSNDIYITDVAGMVEVNGIQFTIGNVTATTFELTGIDSSAYTAYSADGATAKTRSITAAGGTPFTANWVGTILKWYDTEVLVTEYTSSTVMRGVIYGTAEGLYDIDPMKTENGSTTIEVTHALHGITDQTSITIAGCDAVGGIPSADINGARTITLIDENHYSIVSGAGSATSSEDGGGPNVKFSGNSIPTRAWQEQVFTVDNGYPRCCAFFEGRLWLASTPADPSAMWSSKLNQFFNFHVGDALDTDSIQITVGSTVEIAEIMHLTADRDLHIYCAHGEYYSPKPSDATYTPGNFRLIFQTPYGTGIAQPKNFDGATIFAQKNADAVREFLFVDLSNSYQAPSISFLSGHLISSPVQIAVTHGTSLMDEQYGYILNDDGTIAVLLSARAEKMAGWSYYDTYHPDGDALFTSIMVMQGVLYAVCSRNGNYFLEKLAEDDSMMLDSATDYGPFTAKTAWVVDSHYFSQTVSVMSDDYYLGDFAVDGSGNITLLDEVTDITVGFNYTMNVKTVPPRIELPDGTRVGVARRIAQATVHFNNSLNCKINNKELIVRGLTDDLSLPPTPLTGKLKFSNLGYSLDPLLEFTQTAPQRCRVLGATQKVVVQ